MNVKLVWSEERSIVDMDYMHSVWTVDQNVAWFFIVQRMRSRHEWKLAITLSS